MAEHLSVISPFGSYSRGDRITDPATVAAALAENAADVVRLVVDDPIPVPVQPTAPAETHAASIAVQPQEA